MANEQRTPSRVMLPASDEAWPSWGVALLVGGLAAATFLSALRGGFVWDDLAFLPPGPNLLAVRDPRRFFTSGLWAISRPEIASAAAGAAIYRPLDAVAIWLGGLTFGGRTVPWHLFSIALHVASALLVYALARRLTPRASWVAAAAGAIWFAATPAHVEAVAYVTAFVHPMTTLLVLAAAHAHLTHARGGSPAWSAGAALAVMGAVLTCESALLMPGVLLALEWVARERRPPVRVWAGAALAAGIPLLLRSQALSNPLAIVVDAPGLHRAASFGAAYVRDLLSPWPPPPHGSYPRAGVAGVATWIAAAVGVAGIGFYLARLEPRERRRPAFAVAWIVAGLAPIVAAAMNPTPFYAPRALYLPSVGLALLIAAAASTASDSILNRLRWLAAPLVVAGVALGNVAAVQWRDEATVRRRMLEVDPQSVPIRLALADALRAQGRPDEALEQVRLAERFASGPGERLRVLEALGVSLATVGQLEEAERAFAEVLREDPGTTSAWNGAGNVALMRGDLLRARGCYERALAISPRNGEAAYNLASVLGALGDAAGAGRFRALAAEVGVGLGGP